MNPASERRFGLKQRFVEGKDQRWVAHDDEVDIAVGGVLPADHGTEDEGLFDLFGEGRQDFAYWLYQARTSFFGSDEPYLDPIEPQ